MNLKVAVTGVVMVACSNGGTPMSDAGGDAAGDGGQSCELNASSACGTAGGDYAMTTESGCTGAMCGAGDICLSSGGNLTCVSLTAVCGGTAGVVQTVIACHDDGACPASMMCGSLNTCVPNCAAGDGG